MFNLLYVQLFNWAIDPLAKVLCSIGFLFNSFWAIRDVQWDMFGSPATIKYKSVHFVYSDTLFTLELHMLAGKSASISWSCLRYTL